MSEKKKFKIAKKALEALQNLEAETEIEDEVKNNQIVFKSGETTYRVRIPSSEETEDISRFRRKKYIEFLDDDSYIFEADLKAKLKKKNVDISKIDDKIATLSKKIKKKFLELSTCQVDDTAKELEKEILDMKEQVFIEVRKKSNWLANSLENQLMVETSSYTIYLVLEKKVKVKKEETKWERVFKSYEDFNKSKNTDLMAKAYSKGSKILYVERLNVEPDNA